MHVMRMLVPVLPLYCDVVIEASPKEFGDISFSVSHTPENN